MKNNDIVKVIKGIIESVENNINYIENINNYDKINSFRDFIFSRIFDKLSTLGINYIRTLLILDNVKIRDCETLVSNSKLNTKYTEEADIEYVASVLRPLFELYLELKSFKLSFSKLKEEDKDDSIEILLQLVYLEDRFRFDEMKFNVSKDFYDCEPLYYKQSSETYRKEISGFRAKFSQSKISLLKNTRNKLLDVIKQNNKQEKLLLGKDYLTTYAFFSKKTHFSYSNVIGGNLGIENMLLWTLFLYIGIYLDIREILKFKDKISNDFREVFKILNTDLQDKNSNHSIVGNIAVFDFGIGKIIKKEGLNIGIEYIASNNFEKGVIDTVPTVFIQKEISEIDFKNIHDKYYTGFNNLYSDENYEKMYFELMALKTQNPPNPSPLQK